MRETAPIPPRPVTLGALMEAAQASDLTDEQIGNLIEIHFGEVWEPGYFAQPQSDGWRIHAIPCGALGGYADSLGDMPLPEGIDQSNRRADERRRQMRALVNERGSGL